MSPRAHKLLGDLRGFKKPKGDDATINAIYDAVDATLKHVDAAASSPATVAALFQEPDQPVPEGE